MIKKMHQYNLVIFRSPVSFWGGLVTDKDIVKDSLLKHNSNEKIYHLALISPHPNEKNLFYPMQFLSPDLIDQSDFRFIPSGKSSKIHSFNVHFGTDATPEWTGIEINDFFKKLNDSPVHVFGGIYIFQKSVYYINEPEIYESIENIKAFIQAKELKWQKKIDKAKKIATQPQTTKPDRTSIPDDVKLFVWRRDEGRCVKCGSQEKLEFDHIIPISKGGSNTARNIQILCEKCNREKGDNIV